MNIITAENLNTAVAKTLEKAQAAAHNAGAPVFVIVPDRFTLQCERMLMRGVGALLNVRVVTFSMLYNIISDETNVVDSEQKILDKTAAVLFMWRAIQDVGDRLVWFNKSVGHYAFAEKMFNAINQLVSSMADFNNLEKNASAEITRKKMHDIALIRDAYQKLTREHRDGSGMLGYLIENIRHSKLIKEAKIFLTGFEHLSVQRSAVIEELIKAAGEITVGVRNGGEVSKFLAEFVFNKGLQCAIVKCSGKATGDALLDIFGCDKTAENCNLEIAECGNAQEEAAWVANEIACLVKTSNARYGDIVAALGDYDHTAKIFEQTFTQNGIAVNADVGSALLEMPLALFVHNLLLLAGNGKCGNIIAVIKSRYCGFSREEEFELENFCLKYNASLSLFKKDIEYPCDNLRVAIEKLNSNIIPFVAKLSKAKTAEDISKILLQVLERFQATNSEGEQAESVAREKLVKLLTQCSDILNKQRMTLQEFSNMYGTLASATKVSTVPTYADAVTLVSAKEYEASFVPYLFVCGCNAGAFPIEQDDTDIITEFDIANMKARIEPTATLQNSRARVHVVNILSSFTDKLFVSHTALNVQGENGRPSEVVEKLQSVYQSCKANESAAEALYCRGWAANMVLRSVRDGTAFADAATYNSILRAVEIGGLAVPNFEKMPQPLSDARSLFFANSVARVTQFENFFKCPFYHFLQNGLKIRVRESVRAAANVMGSLIHKIVELFLQRIIEKGLDLNVSEEMKRCVTDALDDSEFAYFAAEPVNKPIIASIKKQVQKIGVGLVANIKAGSYRPKFIENKFEQSIANDLKCVGKVDRIDVAELGGHESALVIDYKTGGNSSFSYRQLYLGMQLQLPLYMKALADRYELGGACYLPLRGGFSSDSGNGYKMNGIVLNTEDNAFALDSNLVECGKSGVVSLANKDGKITGGVSQEQLAAVIDYANAMLERAVGHIEAGYIAPRPANSKVCEWCICGPMCMHKDSKRGGNVPTLFVKDIEKVMRGGGCDE